MAKRTHQFITETATQLTELAMSSRPGSIKTQVAIEMLESDIEKGYNKLAEELS